eukprot:3885878-Amphidinium_carterae.1
MENYGCPGGALVSGGQLPQLRLSLRQSVFKCVLHIPRAPGRLSIHCVTTYDRPIEPMEYMLIL